LPTLGPSPVLPPESGNVGALVVSAGAATFFFGGLAADGIEPPDGASPIVSLVISGAANPANNVTTGSTSGFQGPTLPPALSGSTASLSIVGLTVTLTGLADLVPELVGGQVTLAGAGLPGQNRPQTIAAVLSPSSCTLVTGSAFAGSGASISHAGSTSTLTSMGSISAAIGSIAVSGAATSANNGTFPLATCTTGYESSVTVANASGATDANNGKIDWQWIAIDPNSGSIGWTIQPPASESIQLDSAGLTTDANNGALKWELTFFKVQQYVSPAAVIAAALAAQSANAAWFTWDPTWGVQGFEGWGPAFALADAFASALAAYRGTADPTTTAAFVAAFNLAPASRAFDYASEFQGQEA
jgi:hypothetical protein